MPSSTFNSNPAGRAPALKWSRIWTIVLFLALTTVFAFEALLRANKHQPSVVDGPLLWSYCRRQVSNQISQVALLGASRIQVGFSTQTFHEQFPAAPLAVLAISGAHPIAALRDLAEDKSFRGTVICAITAPGFLSKNWDQQQEYVDHFHDSGPSQVLESTLKLWLQERLVVLNPYVRLSRLIKCILRDGRLPEPNYLKTKSDRSRLADYSLVDIECFRERRVIRRQTPRPLDSLRQPFEAWANDVTAVGSLVDKVKQRGGSVVFVRFPTTDEHWETDEQFHPKRTYWDQVRRLTGTETIHFLDVQSLAHFDCPDTSHLDRRDTPKFTAVLLDELVNRGVLSRD